MDQYDCPCCGEVVYAYRGEDHDIYCPDCGQYFTEWDLKHPQEVVCDDDD